MSTDYEFYIDTYKGNMIPEIDWVRVSRMAERKLHAFTFNRIVEISDDDKLVICEMADCMYEYKQREGKSSESTDGYSVSYDTNKNLDIYLYDIVKSAYINTGLLYCGVDYAT